MKTVLVAVSGMSPAIITETVWALACESPPVVPDEVIVITTLKGEDDISKTLLAKPCGWRKTVWETLRKDAFKSAGLPSGHSALQLSVRVIEYSDTSTGIKVKAHDVRDEKQSAETADFILNTLTPHVDAEDCRVIASIAGGRKTMGALLYATMSLVGKEGDRITHVLVSEPFENCRTFFYPKQPVQELAVGDPESVTRVTADKALVEMADIPFVPLRNGFEELNEGRLSFGALVNRYSNELKRSKGGPPVVSLHTDTGVLEVEQRPVRLTGRDLLVAWFLLDRARGGEEHFRTRDEAATAASIWLGTWKKTYPSHQATSRMSGLLSADDITKGLNSLRSKLKAKGLGDCINYLAPERSRIGFDIAES